jgi:amino acid transporter
MPKNIMASRAYEIKHDDPSSAHSVDDKQPYTPATTSEPELKHRSLEQTLVPNIDDDAVEEYKTSDNRRQVGTISAIFLIFNRMVGTGIFATPSEILSLSGSVGLTLFMWVAGMLIAFSGMLVYMEFGTGIPRNGGEKNYLEYVYHKPKFLATAMYAAFVVLLGWAGSNSVIFGEYILNAANVEVGRWNQRAVGLACITSAFLIHGLAVNWGLRLQNFLGVVKLVILLLIIVSGFVSLLKAKGM